MRVFGLIGYPLSHSFSKGYFTEKFRKEAIENCSYENFPIEDISDLPEIIAANTELCGLNVTIPYKEKVIPFLDEIAPEAAGIGAINTIKISRRGEQVHLKGFNTDMYGFMESLNPFLKPFHQRALILGTGGASKAVKAAFEMLHIEYQYVSRTKAEQTITYEELSPELFSSYQVIVNTTPLGMYPKVDDCPPLPYQFLTSGHLLYDLVYNPAQTLFLKKGAEQGAQTANGLNMLHLQAEKAWQIWNS